MAFEVANDTGLELRQRWYEQKYKGKKLKLLHTIILPKKRTQRTEHQEPNKPWGTSTVTRMENEKRRFRF